MLQIDESIECRTHDLSAFAAQKPAGLMRRCGGVRLLLLQKALLVLPRGIEPRTSPLPRECSTPELRQRTSERADPKWNHPANAAGQCQWAGFEASVIRAGLRTLTNDRH